MYFNQSLYKKDTTVIYFINNDSVQINTSYTMWLMTLWYYFMILIKEYYFWKLQILILGMNVWFTINKNKSFDYLSTMTNHNFISCTYINEYILFVLPIILTQVYSRI